MECASTVCISARIQSRAKFHVWQVFLFRCFRQTHTCVRYISVLLRTQSAFDTCVMFTGLVRDLVTQRQMKFPGLRFGSIICRLVPPSPHSTVNVLLLRNTHTCLSLSSTGQYVAYRRYKGFPSVRYSTFGIPRKAKRYEGTSFATTIPFANVCVLFHAAEGFAKNPTS